MTKLSELSKFFKTAFIIVGFACIVLILIFLIFIRAKGQPSTQTSTLQLLPKLNIQNLPHQILSVNTTELSVDSNSPKEMVIYSFKQSSDLLMQADNIAKKFNLSSVKSLEIQDKLKGLGKVYADNGSSLTIFSQSLSYQKVGYSSVKGSFNLEALKQQALLDLRRFGLSSNIGNNPEITYSKIQEESIHETSLPSNADLVNFVFNYQISSFQLLNQTSPVSITYDAQGNFFGLRYFLVPEVENKGGYPIINSDTAVKILMANRKSLIKIDPFTDTVASTPSIQQINLQKAKLAYLLDNTSRTIQPIWVFEGTAEITNTGVKIIAAVPAIDDKYFSKP